MNELSAPQVMMTSRIYSLDEIKKIAPSVFTLDKAPHLTEKYIQTPTSQVVEDLMNLGWVVTKCQEVKARKGKGYQKHLLVFRNPDIMIQGKNGDDAFPQILLTNSHDGKAAFNFRVGLYRVVCSNGLVIADNEFNNMSIRHMNYTFDTLKEKINEIILKLPGLVQKINTFKSKELNEEQIIDFATKAALLRNKKQANIMSLLDIKRDEDKGNSLWSVFNRVEEKIIKGDYNYGNKNRKARSIKNFQQDIKINEQLWQLAETYL